MKGLRKLLVLALVVFAVVGGTFVFAQEDQLMVFDWAGYDLEGFWAPFAEANPDVAVEFTYITEDSEAFARMASGLETDVLHPCWHQPYIEAGLVQPIDTARLTNWESIPEVLTTKGQGEDGEQYFVPHVWGYSSMIIRTDLVEEVPDSWEDLWDPQYAGRIGIYDSGEVAVAIAATVLGLEDPFNLSEEEQALIEEKLIELRPQLLAFLVDPAEMEQLLISGDMWIMAGGWNSTYMTVARALAEANPDATVEYIAPVEGRFGWLCGYGISANAQNVDMAYAYIDALISPESQAYLTNTFGFGGANPESLPMVDPETVELLQLDQTDILNDTIFLPDVTEELREAYATIWDNVKLAP
ncbi:MAG: extracellular solute-binding protein [Chloroflexota bacterium]|nr:extracellular solute-binding protein [Chloroflexota bacterium]